MSEKYLDLGGLQRYDGKLKTWVGDYTYSQSEILALLSAIKTIQIQIVQTLPPVSEGQTNVIYLVPKSQSETNNYYYEYVFISDGANSRYEKIGDTEVDLSNYYTKSETNTLLGGKQDTLTFDNSPTNNSSNPVKSGGIYTALAGKVDKETGKGLSTNDFTNALLSKLNGIAAGAEVNVQANWNENTSTSDAYIQNKPTALSQFTNDITTSISNSEIDALFS